MWWGWCSVYDTDNSRMWTENKKMQKSHDSDYDGDGGDADDDHGKWFFFFKLTTEIFYNFN